MRERSAEAGWSTRGLPGLLSSRRSDETACWATLCACRPLDGLLTRQSPQTGVSLPAAGACLPFACLLMAHPCAVLPCSPPVFPIWFLPATGRPADTSGAFRGLRSSPLTGVTHCWSASLPKLVFALQSPIPLLACSWTACWCLNRTMVLAAVLLLVCARAACLSARLLALICS